MVVQPEGVEETMTAVALTLRRVVGSRAHFDIETESTLTIGMGEVRERIAGTYEVDAVDDQLGGLDGKGTFEGTISGWPVTGTVWERKSAR